MFVGVLSGPLFDSGFLRQLVAGGSFAVVFGLMMTSLCIEYWQVLLAQGLVVGFGCGCLFVPSIAIIPSYFSTRKALAQGLAASGSSLGGVIYPILFQHLQPRIGFGWTVRVLGFVAITTLAVPILYMRQRSKPPTKRKLIDFGAWREAPFILFSIAQFFSFAGLYIPFFYTQLYGLDKAAIDGHLASYLLIFLNAGSFFGRIVSLVMFNNQTILTPSDSELYSR